MNNSKKDVHKLKSYYDFHYNCIKVVHCNHRDVAKYCAFSISIYADSVKLEWIKNFYIHMQSTYFCTQLSISFTPIQCKKFRSVKCNLESKLCEIFTIKIAWKRHQQLKLVFFQRDRVKKICNRWSKTFLMNLLHRTFWQHLNLISAC